MADMEKQEVLQQEELQQDALLSEEALLDDALLAEDAVQELRTFEELEALADEFTLEDLAEFDENFEFTAEELEALKPNYTKKEKLKLILMNHTAFSIVKWSIAGLGIVGLVFHLLALISSDLSETLTMSVSKGVRGALTAVSNLLPLPLMELLVLITAAGVLGYIGFLVYKTIVAKKDGYKIAGYWVQLGYVLVAIFGFGYLLFSLCYGVTTNRPLVYASHLDERYRPNLFTEDRLESSMIFYTDKINEVAIDGMSNMFYTTSGHSRYASTGSSLEEIGEAVDACFDLAAEDLKFLDGGEVVVKKLWFSPLYTAMGIGSMYCPITGEVLINTDYPEMIVPMQVGKAIAKQRGITNDADASFVSFLVCSQYADKLADMGEDYNTDYLKYSAYMDAYMEVGNIVYNIDPSKHLYCGAALKESAKKDLVAFVSYLDALYNNRSDLKFNGGDKTSTEAYKDLAKLLYAEYHRRVDNDSIKLKYPTAEKPVPVSNSKYTYMRYLVAFFGAEYEDSWGEEMQDVYDEYNPQPEKNDGSKDLV